MQNENPKVEDQPIAPEPQAEVVPPSPEPQPEQVTEPQAVEVTPEPVPELIPEPQTPPPTPEPEPTPILEPTPPVVVETLPEVTIPPDPPKLEPVAPESTPEPPKATTEPPKEVPAVAPPPSNPELTVGKNGIPQKVLDLTPEELDAARRLWASRTIHDTQKASVQARHTRRLDLLNQVESFVHSNAPVKLSKVAYELNISEPKASDYLRILVKSGRIKAQGQTTSRRYF